MTELVRRLRQEPWLTAAALLLTAAALTTIWWPRLLPLLDQPNHLAAIQIWNKLDDPRWGFAQWYEYSRVPVPYWGYYFPVHLLSYVLPLEVANKLFLSLYVVAVPLSVACLARALERSPAVALLVFPLIFNHSFAWGFLSFVPGLPLTLFGLAALVRFLDAPSGSRWLVFFALLMATYFMHVLPWMALGLAAGLYLLGRLSPRPPALAALGALLASLAFAVWNTLYCARHNHTVQAKLHLRAGFATVAEMARALPARLITRWPDGPGAEVVLALMLLSLVLLWLTSRATPAADTPPRPWLHRHFAELCALLALAGYLFLPIKLIEPVWIWFVNTRFAALAALFAVLTVRGPIAGRRRWLLVPALLGSLYYSYALTARYLDFNRRAADALATIDAIPQGASTLTLLYGPTADPALDPDYVPFNEFHSYPAVFRGGFNAHGWHLDFPFHSIKNLPVTSWFNPRSFSQVAHGQFYDYVMTYGESHDHDAFGGFAPRIPLVKHVGAWRLYQTRGVH